MNSVYGGANDVGGVDETFNLKRRRKTWVGWDGVKVCRTCVGWGEKCTWRQPNTWAGCVNSII